MTINCQIEPQKHATRFDLRYDIYSGLWCHKPMKELGFECDFVKQKSLKHLHADLNHTSSQSETHSSHQPFRIAGFPSARRGSGISTRTSSSVTDMTAISYLIEVVVARPAAEIQRPAAPGRRPFSDVSHYVFREPDGPGVGVTRGTS